MRPGGTSGLARGALHVGTSGWVYPHWRGTFYPADLPQRAWLSYYAERFGVVELNSTYYRLLSEKAARRWLDEVGPSFGFVVKAHRRITHQKRLRDVEEPLRLFLESLAPLRAHVRCVLFQLPEFVPFDAERLDAFLGRLPEGLPCAFEFRNPGWCNEQTYELLEGAGAAFVVHDMDEGTPVVATSPLAYLRLHGPFEAYRGVYSEEALARWRGVVDAWTREGRDAFVFFNNDEAGYAPRDAARLLAMRPRRVGTPFELHA